MPGHVSGMGGGGVQTYIYEGDQDTMYTKYSGDLTLSGGLTPSVSIGDGDSETRPDNYSLRIWKRIA